MTDDLKAESDKTQLLEQQLSELSAATCNNNSQVALHVMSPRDKIAYFYYMMMLSQVNQNMPHDML
jgi:hypothetical protein